MYKTTEQMTYTLGERRNTRLVRPLPLYYLRQISKSCASDLTQPYFQRDLFRFRYKLQIAHIYNKGRRNTYT